MCAGGIFYADDGTVYNGDFVDDVMEGLMMCVTPDGEKYEGQFRDGLMDGNGIMILPKGILRLFSSDLLLLLKLCDCFFCITGLGLRSK